MFTHVFVGANDLDASKRFYDAALGALGISPGTPDNEGRVLYRTRRGMFGVVRPIDGNSATHGNGTTISFAARTREQAAAWHAAGAATGGVPCEDPPGVRTGAWGDLYLAYLRDPSGNKLCCLHRIEPNDPGGQAG